jgi:hypothetical protein
MYYNLTCIYVYSQMSALSLRDGVLSLSLIRRTSKLRIPQSGGYFTIAIFKAESQTISYCI